MRDNKTTTTTMPQLPQLPVARDGRRHRSIGSCAKLSYNKLIHQARRGRCCEADGGERQALCEGRRAAIVVADELPLDWPAPAPTPPIDPLRQCGAHEANQARPSSSPPPPLRNRPLPTTKSGRCPVGPSIYHKTPTTTLPLPLPRDRQVGHSAREAARGGAPTRNSSDSIHHHHHDQHLQLHHQRLHHLNLRLPANHTCAPRGPAAALEGNGSEKLVTIRTNVIQIGMPSGGRRRCCWPPAAANHAHKHSSSSWLVALIMCLITGLIIALSAPQTACHAYQLTNNLIANNLPPKFVHSSAPTGNGNGGGGGTSAANSEIVVRVKEGPQSIGKLIYTLRAEDPDEDPLTFGVLGTMASELLRIENTPGNQANVYLRKELDRETTESHQVVITLTDGKLGKGNWITKSMLIIVEDVNDNYPVFGPHRTAISLREDSRAPMIVETLEASDADEGRFGQVIYKLDELSSTISTSVGSNSATTTTTTITTSNGADNAQDASRQAPSISSMFAIETIDGRAVITLIGQLDYEQRPLYQLRVLAIDRAMEHERLSTSTSILISVEDCEDQPPMFTFAPSITRIPEDLPIGSPILRLSAIDGDRGVNNPIKYSIISVNNQESGYERNLFSIGSDSGQLSVAHELDRELALGFDPSSSQSSDDYRPPTPPSTATPSQPGAYVIQVRASEVSTSGESADSSPAFVTTELTIILTDVNDETPQFNRDHYFGELLENSPAESLINFVASPPTPTPTQLQTGGAQLAATQQTAELGAKVFDRDQGTNGTFTLHLEGEHGHLFDVWPSEATNEANLMIKVSSSALQLASNGKFFDFERTKELHLTLVAREKFPPNNGGASISRRRFSSAQMVIYLRDVNDNYPQFDSELYRVEVPENAQRGMHICVVKALDVDSNSFGTTGIRYTEIRGERANKFKLDPQTGVITLKTNEHGFDRETIPQHHLIVEARDNNGQGNRNTTQLLIILTDINDQRPKFLLDQYEAFIYENELDFQSPLQVQALDGDAPNSPNSRITYSIVGGDPQSNFTIDPQTGRVRVRSSLVMPPSPPPSAAAGNARQSGGRSSGGAAPATAPAHDVFNDDFATSSSSESAIVIGAGHSATAQATGLDFERIAQKRDDTRQFNLTIRATDSGQPEPLTDTTQVLVLVYDKNDHAPVFTRPVYSKAIREDAQGGTAVVQVQALDGDHSPTNSKITYRISSGASDKFVIDSDSGLISVANGANLDIDRVQGAGQRRTNYLLNIVAFDGSFGPNQKSASTLVNLTIIDVNNKTPEFVSLGASFQQQQPPPLSVAGRNTATLITGNSNQQQQQQQQPTLQNSIVFVNEDAPYGLIVTRVFATDLDSSAELRYAINYSRSEARNEEMALVEPSLFRDVFTIEPSDGTIKVSKQLDRELFDQVKLRLQVEDLAAQTPDQTSYTYLTIRITDINDNRPTFKRPLYKAVVNENSISGTSVITLAADDRDLNKTLRYSLEASSPEVARLIRINPRSGEVTVNDKIDRELYPLINVTVKAEDSGQPHALTGTCQLIVTVRDENDNNPIFLNSTHLRPAPAASTATAALHQARQAPTLTPGAFGQDQSTQPSNHNMQQHQQHQQPSSSYRHRSLAGDQAAGSMLDHQLDGRESSNMATSTSTTSSRSLAAAATNQPPTLDEQGRGELSLLAPGATAWVREDAPIGHQVAYVRAEDADVGNNGRVTYLLDASSSGSGGANGKFRIDRDSGIISVAQPLDRETQRHFALIIEACDNYDLGYSTGESRRAFTQINIQVTDINDNVPAVSTSLQSMSATGVGQLLGAVQATASASGGGYPTYEEAMHSPGPHEMPLSDCLFINEFQPVGEPILTITATDLDDPDTPNGQVDLAIINNLPQNDLFLLVPVGSSSGGGALKPASEPAMLADEPVSISSATSTASSASGTPPETDLSGFGDTLIGSETSSSARVGQSGAAAAKVVRRSTGEHEPSALEPGNFYSPVSNGLGRLPGSPARVAGHQATSVATTTTTTAPTSSRTRTNQRAREQQQQQQQQMQMHIVVSQSLREKVGNYTILVRATDRGQPAPLSSLKLINVCVQDVNNHAPVFTMPPLNHTIRIMENATIGSYVTQVEASDLDHGLNGELQYSLKPTNIQNSNNDWQSFRIDRLSGIISTTKPFNRQLKKYYTLRVQAQDFGRPTPLASDIDINIMIVNSGKYQPEFEQQQQALQFTENSAPGQEWFVLSQTTNLDDDPALIHVNNLLATTTAGPAIGSLASNKNQKQAGGGDGSNWLSSPCYYIIDGDDHEQVFHLDRYTHRLTNQRELDRERKANYTLIVQASNNCNRPQVSNPMVGARALANQLLADEPNTTPGSVSTSTTTSSAAVLLAEDQLDSAASNSGGAEEPLRRRRLTRATQLAQAKSQEPQAGRRALSNDDDDSVELTSSGGGGSGKPQVAKTDKLQSSLGMNSINSEALAGGQAALAMVAPPAAAPPTTQQNWDALLLGDKSLLKVTIRIRDLNDNAPKFTQRIYTGGITTEADFGTTFMIVQAIDLDADANGQVTYSIVRPIKRNLSLSSSPLNSAAAAAAGSPLARQTATSSSSSLRQKRASQSSAVVTTQTPSTTTTTTATARPVAHLQFPFNSNTHNEVYTNEPVPSSSSSPATNHDHQRQPLATANGNNNNNELATNSLLAESDELFVISAQTGEISLNFDPQKHMKGYFEFEILAKDPEGLSDSAKVFIYLLRQDQRVKFVLRLTPQELRQRLNKFRSVMGNITGAIVNIDSYKYYENHDGTVDKKKTSLYLHFVNHEDNTIIEVDKVLTLIDNNIEYLDELYKEFHVLSSEAAHLPLSGSGALVDPIDQVRTGLMGISSFLALILVLVIALCLNQRTRYERQLKAATVSAFGSSPLHLDPDFHSQTNLPNTNLHSQDPNPIWINGHYGNMAAASRHADPTNNIDWLSGNSPPQDSPQAGGGGQILAAGHHYQTSKRPGSRVSQSKQQHQGVAGKQAVKLYHSASSGVGMALDDDDDDDELGCLSSSEADHSSDLNSLSGGGLANSVAKLHYNGGGGGGVATATATPRDSLNSSHGQVSSSSGSNSASTTNERQALCNNNNNNQPAKLKANAAPQPHHVGQANGGGGGQPLATSKHQPTKVKLNNRQDAPAAAAATANSSSSLSNSTFGAFKEVTIYTESQRQQQQQHQQPVQHRSFNHLIAANQQQLNQTHSNANSNSNHNKARQQQPTSHVNNQANKPTASQQQVANNSNNNNKQQRSQQSIYVAAQRQAAAQPPSQKSARILVHTNGSDVNQGIIRTSPHGGAGGGVQHHNQHHQQTAKQNNLDAKFVPVNHDLSQQQQQQHHQDQTVSNFETSLSKLSILNLETTEL